MAIRLKKRKCALDFRKIHLTLGLFFVLFKIMDLKQKSRTRFQLENIIKITKLQKIWSKIQDSDFSQKYDFSFQFFNRSLVKSRRTAQIPTVLNSLLSMLTIPITLSKIYFLTKFGIFCKGVHRFFCEKFEKLKFFRFECQWIGN